MSQEKNYFITRALFMGVGPVFGEVYAKHNVIK